MTREGLSRIDRSLEFASLLEYADSLCGGNDEAMFFLVAVFRKYLEEAGQIIDDGFLRSVANSLNKNQKQERGFQTSLSQNLGLGPVVTVDDLRTLFGHVNSALLEDKEYLGSAVSNLIDHEESKYSENPNHESEVLDYLNGRDIEVRIPAKLYLFDFIKKNKV